LPWLRRAIFATNANAGGSTSTTNHELIIEGTSLRITDTNQRCTEHPGFKTIASSQMHHAIPAADHTPHYYF
jgi:hypothetical protein